jgi:hypothetical protein
MINRFPAVATDRNVNASWRAEEAWLEGNTWEVAKTSTNGFDAVSSKFPINPTEKLL